MLERNIDGVKSTLAKYDFPVDVILETIAICNLRCSICPQTKLTRKRGIMSFDLFKKIIDEVAAENTKTKVWLSLMGEATLLGDKIIEMIRYAADKGLAVQFNTNGILLEELFADKLVNSGVDSLYIGLDAVTEKVYDKIRIGGNFGLVVKNSQYLIKHKKPEQKVIMQFIESENNYNETDAFKDYWISQGAIVKLRTKLGWGTGVSSEKQDIERFPCGWLNRTMTIHWDGIVAQCDGDWDHLYAAGDVNDHTLKEIWNGELAKRREWHWSGDFSHLPCKECNDWQAGRSYFYYPEEQQCLGK